MFKYFDLIVTLAFINSFLSLMAWWLFFDILSTLGHSVFVLAVLMFLYTAIDEMRMNYKIDNNIEL